MKGITPDDLSSIRAGKGNIPNLTILDDPDPNSESEILRRLGITAMDCTFKNFKKRPGSEAALAAFQALANGEAPPLLLCYGEYGNGKTHLIYALIVRLWERGIFAHYQTFDDLMALIKKGMEQDSVYSVGYRLDRIKQRDWLVIDDIGQGTDTKWANEQLDTIVDWRYRFDLPTVLTTNKDIKQLGGRVVSRFADRAKAVTVLNDSLDYRKKGR